MAHEGVSLDPELKQLARQWLRDPLRPPLGPDHLALEADVLGLGGGEGGEVVPALQRRRALRSSASRSSACGHHRARPISSGCRTGEASTR